MILFIKLILALCSIAYELLLAQSMTAFLENTVLRYSVTIGLYLFAMGIGSLVVERWNVRSWRMLWRLEVLLTVVGALSVPALFFIDFVSGSRWVLLLAGHSLIIAIGFLTGFELPIILEMSSAGGSVARNRVIAADYAGALVGSLIFVFWLYPQVGLIVSVLWVALLNALAGCLILKISSVTEPPRVSMWGWQLGVVAALILALAFSSGWEGTLIGLYLKG